MAQTLKNQPVFQAELGMNVGSEISPVEGNGTSLQYSSLDNSMDRGAWQRAVQGCRELDTTERLTLSLVQIQNVEYFEQLI